MTKLFLYMLVACLLGLSLLADVRMGVTLTSIVIGCVAITGLIAYCTRPQEVKDIQRDIGKVAGCVTHTIRDELQTLVKDLEESKTEEERHRIEKKLDEIKAKLEKMERKPKE